MQKPGAARACVGHHPGLRIRPIDDDDRAFDATDHLRSQRRVYAFALAVHVAIGKQSIDALDLVLFVRRPAATPPELRERERSASECRFHNRQQR